VSEQVLDVGKLAVAVIGAREISDFEFTAEFEPLDDRLEIDFAEVLGEDTADSGAN